MQIFATIEAGRATGFFPSDLFPTPPTGSVPISNDLWLDWINHPDKIMVDGALIDPPAPPPLVGEALDALKTSLRTAIDAEAERQRLRYITAGAGQAMTYARKTEEAKAASADATPTAEAYPLLAASVGIDGADIAAVAAVVLAMDAQWSVIGAAIEAARLSAKKAVTEAADEATARSAAVVTWPA
ncbi:MAG TPA: hypothetical protein VNX29_05485 [Kaistia sp.]|nr:hypothetical protein [Kaistia sp.]